MISIFAFISVIIIIPFICRLASKAGFVDRPEGRKQHERAVPPLGGLVIFSVFLIFIMMFGNLSSAVIGALALILVVGIIDDAWEINAVIKFVIHFAAAFIIVIFGHSQIQTLGDLLGTGTLTLAWMAIPFSVACIVYIQNAMNMMDGVDGLAGGQSFLIFSWFLLAASSAGNNLAVFELSLLMACIFGFLIFNMRSPFLKSAKIFLGDAGSMSLGLLIAWYAITLSQGGSPVISPVSIAWIIALPIFDSFALLVARLKDKKPPFVADRRHFHHHFASAGFSAAQTTLIILSYSTLLGTIGYFSPKFGVPDYILGWGWISLWIGHTVLTIRANQFIKFLTKVKSKLS